MPLTKLARRYHVKKKEQEETKADSGRKSLEFESPEKTESCNTILHTM